MTPGTKKKTFTMSDEALYYQNTDLGIWMALRNKLGLSRHSLDKETKDPDGYFSWPSAT